MIDFILRIIVWYCTIIGTAYLLWQILEAIR